MVIDGQLVVDLWGGSANQAGTTPWQADTLVNVASATKGAVAIALHHLVDHGHLDLDAPVAAYWPAFAQAGKAGVTIRSVLDHTAGLAAFRRPMRTGDLFDWSACTAALETQEPLWPPGAAHGYHALTFGWLVGELIRRATGATPGTFLRDILPASVGDDVRIGLPEPEHHRVAEMGPHVVDPTFAARLRNSSGSDVPSIPRLVFTNPPLFQGDLVNTPAWRAAEIPAANGHATARGLARLYGAIVGPEALLNSETVRRCSAARSPGPDLVLGIETCFSLGFMRGIPHASGAAFGHPGAGGALGFCDPHTGVGFGYVTNRMEPSLHVGRRAARLIRALADSLDAPYPGPAKDQGAISHAVDLH